MQLYYTVILISCSIYSTLSEKTRYEPSWESLDKRPLPGWYDDAKIGIFLHWGVYSVPGFGAVTGSTSSEWFWLYWKNGNPAHKKFMRQYYPPEFSYQDFAKEFRAEFFDPNAWANLFQKSGAKYVVLTSKHHDGFTLWPSTYSFGWNAQDVGPKQDLIGNLSKAIRDNTDLKFGLYYSLYEWFHPRYMADKESHFTNNTYMVNKAYPEMIELVKKYKPEVVWADGDWDTTEEYFKSLEFLAWLYNDSPVKDTAVANDRWGKGIPCEHGDFYTCTDRFNPGVLQEHKWENAMTIDKQSWGHRRVANINDYLTTQQLIKTMVETVSCGGNILINVGPTSEGTIAPIYQERLLELGDWLSINGEAIYSTKPWTYQNDSISQTWYTSTETDVYAITLEWPTENILELGLAQDLFSVDTEVNLLGNPKSLLWRFVNGTTYIKFPPKHTVENKYAWVVKIKISDSNNNLYLGKEESNDDSSN